LARILWAEYIAVQYKTSGVAIQFERGKKGGRKEKEKKDT
jgi:hypothetical protein